MAVACNVRFSHKGTYLQTPLYVCSYTLVADINGQIGLKHFMCYGMQTDDFFGVMINDTIPSG